MVVLIIKYRLKKCGLKNVIYLIENFGKNYHGAVPLSRLLQAAANSCVQDNFTVKFTQDHKDSMRYLSVLTKMLIKIYEVLCVFIETNFFNNAQSLVKIKTFYK